MCGFENHMDKSYILAEIKRTAEANGDIPLGRDRFFQETGIKDSDWSGRFWVRWGEAVAEAGLKPNTLQVPTDENVLIDKYIGLIRELGRLPVKGDLMMKRRLDASFPSHNTFTRFGDKPRLVARIRDYCQGRQGYEDVLALCQTAEQSSDGNLALAESFGFVYLIRSGKYYKIGRSNAPRRRERELAIQLPEKSRTLHTIKTDDPAGIEAYWHRRFENRRKNGEWFELTSLDVRAFTRRKFM
jgi:hypothetical protein